MSTPDPWTPMDEPDPGAYLRPDEHEKQALLDGRSTQVDHDATSEVARAVRVERRAAYLDGVHDEHHPDL
ncbi:hypothetical protein SEA_RUBYRALPH_81 [Microbacterium phage RubyRalph]|nr:hypothetical protein SEA_RUBYRALPH_81 [Microbacterium phage RubyRalph]